MPVQRRRPLSFHPRAMLLSSTISLLALGCAHSKADTEVAAPGEDEPEVAQLRRDNAALRARVQNLEERVRMLEREGAMASYGSGDEYQRYGSLESDAPDTWEEQPESDGPRQLPVVKLTPAGKSIERPEPSPEARGAAQPTTVTRGRGSISLSAVPHSGSPEYADDYVIDPGDYEESAPDVAEPSGQPASYRLVGSKLVQATKRKPVAGPSRDRDKGVVKDYDKAMDLYRDGRYSEAEQAFSAIVSAHPDHDYADNALYWQGEAAYDQAHYADALAAFTKVVEHYGGGNKAPDALLKIGLCYGRLGDAANASDVLTQLIAAYPTANASKIAKRKLDDLED